MHNATRRSAAAVLTLLATLAALTAPARGEFGDGPPVTRIWTPNDQASRIFPAEAQPRSLPAADFERLLESARTGWLRERAANATRLLRVDHYAKLKDGVLEGRSVLRFEASSSLPREGMELEPWSPALTSPSPVARHRADGSLRIQPAPSSANANPNPSPNSAGDSGITDVSLSWIVPARRGSEGRRFELDLPNQGLNALTLDLPEGEEPDAGSRLIIRDPGGEPGRALWRIGDARGRIELWIHSTANRRRVAGMGGPVRIEVQESHALWIADWTFDPGAGASRDCALELDPRLSVLEVSGAAVAGFEIVPDSDRNQQRLTIKFADRRAEPVAFRIRATLPTPAEGEWLAPWSRPADAIWLPGQTTIVLDQNRELAGCVAESGWRVPLTQQQRLALDPAGKSVVLVFDPLRPGPVARLELQRPGAAAHARMRGTAIFERVATTLTAAVSWNRVNSGNALQFDLSPGWTPTRIEEDGAAGECVWARREGSDLPPGWTRWAIWPARPNPNANANAPADPETAAAERKFRIDAKRDAARPQDPWTLPRLRPYGVFVADESWNALCDPELSLRPITAAGLVWTIPPSPGAFSARLPSELAWRWDAATGEAFIDRVWRPAHTEAETAIRIAAEPGKTSLDGALTLHLGERRIQELAIQWLGSPTASRPSSWRCRLDSGPEWRLEVQPLRPESHASQGLAPAQQGPGERLTFPIPVSGRVTLEAHWEAASAQQAAPTDWPIPSLPASIRTSGRVAISANPLATLDVQTEEMWPVDFATKAAAQTWMPATPALSAAMSSGSSRSSEPPRRYFAYSGSTARIAGASRLPTFESSSGLIQEAILRTQLRDDGPFRHRLSLRVARGTASALDIVLPEGCVLEHIERDGEDLAPLTVPSTTKGQAFSVPLPPVPKGGAIRRINLEYSAPQANPSLRDSERRQPARPEFSLPCAAFCWETASVSPQFVREVGGAFIPSAPFPSPLTRRFGETWSGESLPMARRQEFERWLSATSPEPGIGANGDDLTLGSWLRALDADDHPLIIDRSALEAAGWGPGSTAAIRNDEADPPRPSVQDRLEAWGLAAAPLGNAILITSRRDAPPPDQEFPGWPALTEQVLLRGHDRADRFETVERWLGEPTPTNKPELDAAAQGSDGWIRQRFHALGWPRENTEIILDDPDESTSWGWAVAAAIAIAAVAWRDLPWKRRACGLAAALASLLTIFALASRLDAGWSMGVWTGGLAASSYWWGRALHLKRQRGDVYRRRRGRAHRRIARPSTIRPRVAAPKTSSSMEGPGLGATLLLCMIGSAFWLLQAQAAAPRQIADDEPIQAILPFDPREGPKSPPDRVIIRKTDEDRLRRWSEAATRSDSPLTAISASHDVEVADPKAEEAVVRSEFELIREGDVAAPAPAATEANPGAAGAVAVAGDWDFPIGSARGLTAELDGRAAPILVLPGGSTGRVRATGPGRHRLILKRTVARSSEETGWTLRLPINPQSAARIAVGEGGGPVEFNNAVDQGSAKSKREALLGPARQIELRWPSNLGDRGQAPSRIGAEILTLWDALPGGDRLYIRIGLRSPRPLNRLRLRLPEGVLARSPSPRVRLETLKSEQGRTEWIAEFAEPIASGTFDLRIWEPASLTTPAPNGNANANMNTSRRRRSPPLLELPDAVTATGALALRRLSSWDGDLRSAIKPGIDLLADQEYADAWGDALPSAGFSAIDAGQTLTLAGSTRFDDLNRLKDLSVAIGPPVSRPTVRANVALTFEPGRLGVAADAEWSDPDRQAFEARIELPPELRVSAVYGDGLTSWSQPKPGSLRLRFDGEPLAKRRLRWEGKISLVETEPNAAQGQRTAIPWPKWLDAVEMPGALTIDANEALSLRSPLNEPEANAGAILLTGTERRAPGPLGSLLQGEYRIVKPDRLPKLRWRPATSRTVVLARSCLTLTRDQAIWTVLARYRSSGGPLSRCALTMPTPWAPDRLDIGSEDGTAKRRDDDQGHTIWSLDLKRPVWGEFEIRFQVKRPWIGGEPLDFPDLAPLGPGNAGIYLAVVDASGGAVRIDREEGLRKVEGRSLDWADVASVPAIEPMAIYEARQNGWMLLLTRDDSKIAPATSHDARARTELADLTLTVGENGEIWGEATYWLESGTAASWLWLRAPDSQSVDVIWAAVDGEVVEIAKEPRGRRRIPILKPSASIQVRVIWRANAASAPNAQAPAPGVMSLLPLLTPDQPGVRGLITVYAPNGVDIQAVTSDSRKIPAGWHEIELLERSAIRFAAELKSRTRRGDAASLPPALALDLKRLSDSARDIERLAQRVPDFVKGELAERIEKQLGERVGQARAMVDQALRDQELPAWDWENGSFRLAAGTAPENQPSSNPISGADARFSAQSWGLRRLGDPIHFEAVSEHDGHPPRIGERRRASSAAEPLTLASRSDRPARNWTIVGLIATLWLSAAGLTLILADERLQRGESLILIACGALTGAGALLTTPSWPIALGVATALAVFGWISARPSGPISGTNFA